LVQFFATSYIRGWFLTELELMSQWVTIHWLKVPERIQFRLCVLAYRCLNSTAPSYLAETLHWLPT